MVIQPGKSEQATIEFNPLGKSGEVLEEITVISNDPTDPVLKLHIAAQVKHDPGKLTGAQFQSIIFSEKCARCHGIPAAGSKSGAGLYAAVCLMCHGGPEQLKTRDRAELTRWTAVGDASKGMPGYAHSVGGPLSDSQIQSLVELTASSPPRQDK